MITEQSPCTSICKSVFFVFSDNPEPVRNAHTVFLSLGVLPPVPGDNSYLDAIAELTSHDLHLGICHLLLLLFPALLQASLYGGRYFLEEQLIYQPKSIVACVSLSAFRNCWIFGHCRNPYSHISYLTSSSAGRSLDEVF